MSEQTAGPAAPPTRGRLERPRHGRAIFGVCAALGRYTDVDPVIYRVILVALTIFGGLGVALYAAGWLLIPEEGEPSSKLERFAHRYAHRLRTPAAAAIAIGVLLFLALVTATNTRNIAVTVLLLALVAYLLLRRPHVGGRTEPVADGPASAAWWSAEYAATHPAPASASAPAAPEAETPPTSTAPVATAVPTQTRTRPPGPSLGLLTVSACLIVVGSLVALRIAGVDQLTAVRILAVGVAVLAGGLLVGTWIGRARWLVAPGTLLAVVTIAIASLGVPLSGGVGERTWVPVNAADVHPTYRLAAGRATLDLSSLTTATGLTTVTVSVGMGRLDVIVPHGASVDANVHSAAGQVVVLGRQDNGLGAEQHVLVGPVGRHAGPAIDLTARVGFGRVEVRRAAA